MSGVHGFRRLLSKSLAIPLIGVAAATQGLACHYVQVNRGGISIGINKQRIRGDAVGVLTRSRLPVSQSASSNTGRRSHTTTNAIGKKIVVIGGDTAQPTQCNGIICGTAGGVTARVPENVVYVIARAARSRC